METQNVEKLTQTTLAQAFECSSTTISEAAKNGETISGWPVSEWAVIGPGGKISHYEVPTDSPFLRELESSSAPGNGKTGAVAPTPSPDDGGAPRGDGAPLPGLGAEMTEVFEAIVDEFPVIQSTVVVSGSLENPDGTARNVYAQSDTVRIEAEKYEEITQLFIFNGATNHRIARFEGEVGAFAARAMVTECAKIITDARQDGSFLIELPLFTAARRAYDQAANAFDLAKVREKSKGVALVVEDGYSTEQVGPYVAPLS